MTQLSFWPVNVLDLLADTDHLSDGDFGAYFRLLAKMWITGRPVPKVPAQISNITRRAKNRFKTLEPVFALFVDTPEGYWHPRIAKDRARALKRRHLPNYSRGEINNNSDSGLLQDCGIRSVTGQKSIHQNQGFQRVNGHKSGPTESESEIRENLSLGKGKNPANGNNSRTCPNEIRGKDYSAEQWDAVTVIRDRALASGNETEINRIICGIFGRVLRPDGTIDMDRAKAKEIELRERGWWDSLFPSPAHSVAPLAGLFRPATEDRPLPQSERLNGYGGGLDALVVMSGGGHLP